MASRAWHYKEGERLLELAAQDSGKNKANSLVWEGMAHFMAAGVSDELARELAIEDQRKVANGGIKLPPWASTSPGAAEQTTFQIDHAPNPPRVYAAAPAKITDHHYIAGGYGLCAAGIGGGEGCDRPMVDHAFGFPTDA